MTEDEKSQMFLDEVQEQAGLPKIKLSPTGSCYNYNRLKKEGLVDDTSKDDETDAYDKIPPRY